MNDFLTIFNENLSFCKEKLTFFWNTEKHGIYLAKLKNFQRVKVKTDLLPNGVISDKKILTIVVPKLPDDMRNIWMIAINNQS